MARILVVDDSLAMRFNLKRVLTERGHEVVGEAANGEEAVHKYFALKPDIVTMDVTMPVMDGISALACIRERDPGATVIMITALGQKSMVLDAINAGAANYLVKPFDPCKTVEVINSLLSSKSGIVGDAV